MFLGLNSTFLYFILSNLGVSSFGISSCIFSSQLIAVTWPWKREVDRNDKLQMNYFLYLVPYLKKSILRFFFGFNSFFFFLLILLEKNFLFVIKDFFPLVSTNFTNLYLYTFTNLWLGILFCLCWILSVTCTLQQQQQQQSTKILLFF